MGKVLILYYSGVGATKKIAELIYSYLSLNCAVDIFSVENETDFDINDYDAFVIGTPVYHAAPARRIMNFIKQMKPLNNKKPAFIYNTKTLCACNTNRILSKKLWGKNILTVMDRAYQSPASDGTLIVPFVKRFFEFEKDLQLKIGNDCVSFLKELQKDKHKYYIPHFRLSSVINAPDKLAGQLTTFKIHLHKEKCIKCGKCINKCPHNALEMNLSSSPVFISKKCENYYRCIHQ